MTEDFGPAYMLKQLIDDVREMRSSLVNVATKTEMAYVVAKIEDFVPRGELDKKFDERDVRFEKSHAAIMEAVRDGRSQVATKAELQTLATSLENLQKRLEAGPVAAWLLPTIGVIFSILWPIGLTLFNHGGKP